MQQRTYTQYICAICDKQTKHCCSKCKDPFYCSKEHQKLHWKMGHNLECIQQQHSTNNQLQLLQLKRIQLRSTIINLINLNHQIQSIQSLTQISQQIYEIDKTNTSYYEMTMDMLLKPKILLNYKLIKECREELIYISSQIEQYFNLSTIITNNYDKQELINRIKILEVINYLFQQCGDTINTLKYLIRIVEETEYFEGEESFKTAQAYQQLAEQLMIIGYRKKALLSLERSKEIFQINKNQEKVADCDLQIGKILITLNQIHEAKESFERSLKVRKQIIGSKSLQVAECLEELGKLLINVKNYKSALSRMEECYLIKKHLIKDLNHEEIIKTSIILIDLFQKIRDSKNLPKISDEQLINELDKKIDRLVIEKQLNFQVKTQILSDYEIIGNKYQENDLCERQLVTKRILQNNSNQLIDLQNFRNEYLEINKELMLTLNVEQLQLLKQLNIELNQCNNLQQANEVLLGSQFIKYLSKIQFQLLKDKNQKLFNYQINNPFKRNNLCDSDIYIDQIS